MKHVVALFGESEKGQFQRPYLVHQLPELMDCLGNPPPESEGLVFAIQALLYERRILYFRVEEEGFSHQDYLAGAYYLQKQAPSIGALCLPGVGDRELLSVFQELCLFHGSFLITSEKDLYDYLMH